MTSEAVTATVHRAWAADLDRRTLYELLRLRVDVFVVEQACPYAELDGRDLEDRARGTSGSAATAEPEPVLGYLRLLKEPDGELPHRAAVHGPLGARARARAGS